MKYSSEVFGNAVNVKSSIYTSGGRRDVHAAFTPGAMAFDAAFADLREAMAEFGKVLGDDLVVSSCRFMLADPANDAASVLAVFPKATVIGQAPCVDTAICALVQYVEGRYADGAVVRGSYAESHRTFTPVDASEPEAPVRAMSDYVDWLGHHGLTLEADCLRTWFFVRDIDRNYRYVVDARNRIFACEGLNRNTHFIASTGIGADASSTGSPLTLETLTVSGLKPGQISYIKALSHLNDTIEYGVAFERATAVDYGDRRVVYISGTASIDNRGQIIGERDIVAQTERMILNVRALLDSAAVSADDLQHVVVYCRNRYQSAAVAELVGRAFPGVPALYVQAPVCRPGWLVEMECMAMKPQLNDAYAPY